MVAQEAGTLAYATEGVEVNDEHEHIWEGSISDAQYVCPCGDTWTKEDLYSEPEYYEAELHARSETFTMPGGTVLVGVHTRESCGGDYCVVHCPKHTHMDDWPLIWRDDRGIFERIDPLGCGHPDPSQFDYWERTNQEWQTVHGCTGLCNEELYEAWREAV